MPNWVTVMVGGLLTLGVNMIPSIPQPYGAVIGAVITAGSAIWHLYTPVPVPSK